MYLAIHPNCLELIELGLRIPYKDIKDVQVQRRSWKALAEDATAGSPVAFPLRLLEARSSAFMALHITFEDKTGLTHEIELVAIEEVQSIIQQRVLEARKADEA